jgi:raffinose/stachyose/melibiose transport system permease protein
MKKSRNIRRGFAIGGGILAAIYAFPFFLVLLNSFKEKRDIRNNPLSPPQDWLFSNYLEAAERMEYFQSLTNSIVVTHH